MARTDRTEFEARIAHALQAQFGANWWLHGAHPQTVDDYLRAANDAGRASAQATMQRDAITRAASVIQAAIGEGLVQVCAWIGDSN